MSDFISTSQETVRDACIATYVHARNALHGVAERAKEDRGQTAAEYMGVLLLIAVIITAIVGSGMGSAIADALKDKVSDIAGIKKPDCSVKGAC
jgi:pilus assembly protein Flp/PilA